MYCLWEQKPGTSKHYAGWFDDDQKIRLIYLGGEPLTTEMVFKLRNKTHDGELAIFPDLTVGRRAVASAVVSSKGSHMRVATAVDTAVQT